eukprot:scaffold6781_cov204-Amphora_coffeaeformis.AAC.22
MHCSAIKDLPSWNETRQADRVSFSQVLVREYEQIFGDALTTCIGAPPLSIGWSYFEQWTAEVDEYELTRKGQRRDRQEMLMPSLVRIQKLMENGYTRRQIHQVMEERRQEATSSITKSTWKRLTRAWKGVGQRREMNCQCKALQTANVNTCGLVGILKNTTTASSRPSKRTISLKSSPKNLWVASHDHTDSDTEGESDDSLSQGVSLRYSL